MHSRLQQTRNTAFSLVELSIVLVILGLLTGGILAGQSLIRAAELRSGAAEYSRYMTAFQSFRDKYFALPGDMNNATKFWGTADTTTCSLTSTGDARTCDGNGDGYITSSFSGNAGHEWYRSWQQLSNAGLIEGQYAGIRFYMSTDGGENQQFDNVKAGYNAPASRINNGTWHIQNSGTYSGNTAYFNGIYNHTFFLGGNLNYAQPVSALVKPEDAWNLDSKLDDGLPATGKVRSNWNSSCTTAASAADVSATYNLSYSSLGCFLLFPNLF